MKLGADPMPGTMVRFLPATVEPLYLATSMLAGIIAPTGRIWHSFPRSNRKVEVGVFLCYTRQLSDDRLGQGHEPVFWTPMGLLRWTNIDEAAKDWMELEVLCPSP